MATLDQLYTRLILDLARDDMGVGGELEQAKIDAVADAIEAHADTLFWFNRASGTAATVAATAALALPAGMRIALLVTCRGAELAKVGLEEIQAGDTSASGPPARWAEDEGAIHLQPTPDAAYALSVHGIAEIGVPATGGNANAWTTEARELILAEAKIRLCRGPLRDPDGLALARDARGEALGRLRRETARRRSAPMATDLPVPAGFDIRTG